MIMIPSILCILLGIAAVCKPRLFWTIGHFWSVKDGEPTELYLILQRIIGGVAFVIGVAGVIVTFLI